MQDYILSGPNNINPVPHVPFGKFLYHRIKEHGDKIAQVDAVTGETRTYTQLLTLSLSVANSLWTRGIRPGDVVAICSENNLDFVLPVLAAYYIGATCATLNPNYTTRELEHALKISKPCIVFTSERALHKIVQVSRSISEIREVVSFNKEFISFLQDTSCSFKPTDESDPGVVTAAILCSSGTTGFPKGVMVTQKNILTVYMHMIDPRYGAINNSDVVLAALPFFHAYLFVCQLVSICTGIKVIVMPKFEEELFLKSIQKHKVSLIFLVPPVILFLAKSDIVDKYDLSSIRELRCGAAPLSEEMETAVMKRLKLNKIRQGYGMTETTLGVTLMPTDKSRFGSVGILVPQMKCKVVDLTTGEILGPNKPGELCFKGPLIMKGYRGDFQATSATFDEDGFLHTGDVGYYDQEGFFYIVDRIKELIKYKGYQVPPAELEAILLSHPDVKDAAVIGIPDESTGELPMAFIVKQPGARVTQQQIIKFVADQVSPQKRLHGGVMFVDTIPKNPSGKILRRVLRQMMKTEIATLSNVKNILIINYINRIINYINLGGPKAILLGLSGPSTIFSASSNLSPCINFDLFKTLVINGPKNINPVPHVPLGKYFYQKIMEHGDKIAQVDAVTGETRMYSQLLTLSLSVANSLWTRGIRPGDVVAICSENNLDFVLPVLAAYYIGATCATLNPNYTTRELEHALKISKPCIVFASQRALHKIVEVSHSISEIREIVGFGKTFPSLLQDTSRSFKPTDEDDPDVVTATILYSSGTTGLPKGVMITQKNILTVFMHMIGMHLCLHPANNTVYKHVCDAQYYADSPVLPVEFFGRLYQIPLLRLVSICTGIKVIVMPKFEEELFLKSIQNHKVTLMYLVPPIILFLAKSDKIHKYNMSSVRDVVCGAAPLCKQVADAVMKRFNLNNIRQCYGLTETTFGVVFTTNDKFKFGSIGKLFYPSKVVDQTNGEILGPNKQGELCFKGPLIMKGYCGDFQATSATVDEDGFLHTGDVGYYDQEGFFYIVDRIKELIKYKGYQVPPAELEAILLSHPDVKDAAVIGIPDESTGELPMAFIVKQPGAHVTQQQIIAFAADQLSPQKRLRGGVIFVDTIPKNPSGKILRRALREMVKNKL
ncbi:hypothetical protein L9F63_002523 [Diploptera punctata]|uniref:Luciferin 4-monooxygenase n=1 Tax=Diploptera punctata TaxID=6984 RepID=A0AAD8ECY3_DIPPU|nr:hypothetical protein L9F63_002523 [Diploptera punctata]